MDVSNGVFNIYVAALAISGVVMLVVACLPIGQSTASRAIGAILGAGFLGYAIYLKFIFDGGSFVLFYYVFAIPLIYIARVVKAYAERRNARQAGHHLMPPPQAQQMMPPTGQQPMSPPPGSRPGNR